MSKRILSTVLTLVMTLLMLGSAFAATEDDYTLPEVMYQQFSVQNYPIRGSMALTASGTASWLDLFLPVTASTLHLRLLNLEESDDFQYQIYAEDDDGNQQGLTQLYRVGDSLYLRSALVPDTILTVSLNDSALQSILGTSAGGNPSFYSVLLGIANQPSMVLENTWAPLLDAYLNSIELWLADYASDPTTITESDEMRLQITYVIPAENVKALAKQLWHTFLYDQELLALIRPLMTEAQQDTYLNTSMLYFYDACIDALPLTGELRLSRTLSTHGDTLSVAVALPLPQNPWGYTNLTFKQEEQTTTLMLMNEKQTLTLSVQKSEDVEQPYSGYVSRMPAADAQDVKPLRAAFAFSYTHSETSDSSKRYDNSEWKLLLTPDIPEGEEEQYETFEPITAELTLQYNREKKEAAPVRLNITAGLHMAEADLTLRMALRTTGRWNALDLPTDGAQNVTGMDSTQLLSILSTAMNSLTESFGSQPISVATPADLLEDEDASTSTDLEITDDLPLPEAADTPVPPQE